MPYTPRGPFTDNSVSPPINAAFLNGVETQLAQNSIYQAPPPSGGDDTAALQALINTAITTSGTGPGVVLLQYGTYKVTGLTTASGFYQPRIIGRGKQSTTIQSTNAANPVIRFVGASGSITSGAILDVTIAGTDTSSATAMNGVGIELVGCGGVEVRAQFTNLATGLRFYNRDSGTFTEFCVARDCNWNFCGTALEYRATSGNDSFHGSGIEGNSIINLVAGANAVTIGAGSFVYSAPLNVTIFSTGAGTSLISNQAGPRPAAFHGDLKVELQNATSPFTLASGTLVFLNGTVQSLGGYMRMGQLYEVDKVYWTGTLCIPQLRPFQRFTVLQSGTTQLMSDPVFGPGSYLIHCTIAKNDSSYLYSQTLLAWQSPINSTGTVTTLATHVSTNTSGAGAPVFGWNSGLTVTNSNYANTYTTEVSVVPFTAYNGGDNLGQV